jgi:hypothetical protein
MTTGNATTNESDEAEGEDLEAQVAKELASIKRPRKSRGLVSSFHHVAGVPYPELKP